MLNTKTTSQIYDKCVSIICSLVIQHSKPFTNVVMLKRKCFSCSEYLIECEPNAHLYTNKPILKTTLLKEIHTIRTLSIKHKIFDKV